MPDWRPLYPFDSHYLDLDGFRYHYLDEGSGETLLLVHGNPTWSFHWRELIQRLHGRYRLIAVDHMGCGLSDKPQHYPYRLDGHIANLVRLVEHLDLRRVTLVGHDWGGAIGLGAATAMPERFSRIVLLNTAAFRSTSMPLRIRVCRTPLLGAVAVRGLNLFLRAAFRMAVVRHNRMTPEVRAGYLAPYNSWANRVAIDRFVRDIPMHPKHPSYDTVAGIENTLPRLAHLPTLFVWGMRDWCFTPKFLDRFREFFPRAEVLSIEDAGHWVIEDAPDQVVQRIEQFLNDHPLGFE